MGCQPRRMKRKMKFKIGNEFLEKNFKKKMFHESFLRE